ncbi:acyl-CoA thioesterase II [Novosphingobium sp.]|uniref:acyl-CoA thioesterase n=1 Tax=Novosphingobium sp. TaxID=1874826 RepID=UPI00286A8747|nr:acyl-CoA thioesterase II [Novosphingobium sp.]
MEQEHTPEQLVAGLIKLLEPKSHGEDRYEGRKKRGGVGRVFGGQVIAQALLAADDTVETDRPAHSLHAYFLRGGAEEFSIDYEVARDFDGGSFSNRRVVASQQGRPILNLTASFQRQQEGLHHVDAEMPDVPGPEELESETVVRLRYAETARPEARHHFLSPRPVEMRAVEGRHWTNPQPAPPRSHSWFKTVAPLPDDPRIHRAVLAFASDMTLLGTCALPHGLSWARGEVVSASLDHAVWFHENFRADEWLLYATDSPWSGGGRGFNRGRIFTQDGRLVASVAQEGMIRKAVPKG